MSSFAVPTIRRCAVFAFAGVVAALLLGASAREVPRELGRVAWERDFAAAQQRAEASGLPLFALFQEVPGCATCVSFGEQVLSHPLLVEAIETEFVATAVLNNRGGADREVLQRFGEPSWNNPVVRFLDGSGDDWIPRRDRVWTPDRIGERMIAALEAAGRPVPSYLTQAVDELRAHGAEQATFSMHCFWSGEACLAGVDGIVDSRAGWLAGREVVEVTFDPEAVSYDALLRAALAGDCAREVFTHSARQLEHAREIWGDRARPADGYARAAKDSDQKRALRGTVFEQLDLTPRQAVRINGALARGQDPSQHLSPRQKTRAKALGTPTS